MLTVRPVDGGNAQPDEAHETPRATPEQRAALGKAARAKAPLESHADFRLAKSRDPVGLLLSQAKTRVPELVPIRHGRMLVSPFAFYRGAALIMAADLNSTATSGLQTQLCGDAHLSNFGAYASPERRLVFDRIAISHYLGNSNTFDIAVTDFAERYADQNERDHAALAAAVADGRVEAQSGV